METQLGMCWGQRYNQSPPGCAVPMATGGEEPSALAALSLVCPDQCTPARAEAAPGPTPGHPGGGSPGPCGCWQETAVCRDVCPAGETPSHLLRGRPLAQPCRTRLGSAFGQGRPEGSQVGSSPQTCQVVARAAEPAVHSCPGRVLPFLSSTLRT